MFEPPPPYFQTFFLTAGVDQILLQGAGHNDVELYNQYLERLKTFVSTELTNWRGPKDPKSPELLNAKKMEEEEEGVTLTWDQTERFIRRVGPFIPPLHWQEISK